MSHPRETKAGEELTEIDWIGAASASLGAVVCCQFAFFIGPASQKMFADFGDQLPAITGLALTRWFPLLFGLTTAFMVALALVMRTPLGVRRGLIVGAWVLSLSAGGFCLYAVYAMQYFPVRAIR